MGRLRNISASFTAAFHSKENLSSTPSPPERGERIDTAGYDSDKDRPVITKETSRASQADSTIIYGNGNGNGRGASRSMSGHHHNPAAEMGRDLQVEELVPVFRCASP